MLRVTTHSRSHTVARVLCMGAILAGAPACSDDPATPPASDGGVSEDGSAGDGGSSAPDASGITVAVDPAAATVNRGATQNFAATVAGSSNPRVVWSIEEGERGGVVTTRGRYTAGTSTGTFHIIATSEADPAARGIALVTVPDIGVRVQPSSAMVLTRGRIRFAADVTGSDNTGVDWSVREENGGSISTNGTYTAPEQPGTYRVIATSREDNTKSGTALVTVTEVGITIDPPEATVAPGSSAQFVATITGTTSRGVTWVVEESEGGTITRAGYYTAPDSPKGQPFHITAIATADPTKSAEAVVYVVPINVTVTPPSATVAHGQMRRFTATVTGTGNRIVRWSIAEGPAGGSITSNGVYTAPSVSGTYHILAASAADPRVATRVDVQVVPPSVTIRPANPTIYAGLGQSFQALVAGDDDNEVTWAVDEASGGTIVDGYYTAPSVPGTYHVTASSLRFPGVTSTTQVTVLASSPRVLIGPIEATLAAGSSQRFAHSVLNTSDRGVTWVVDEGASGGTIAADGTYTAPGTPGTYHITARSNANPSRTRTATISVVMSSVYFDLPPEIALRRTTPGATLTFYSRQAVPRAGVTNIHSGSREYNSNSTWSVVQAGDGTFASAGVYTAPSTPGTYNVRVQSTQDASLEMTAVVVVVPTSSHDTWRPLGAQMLVGRESPTMTLLADGRVLIVGGRVGNNPTDAAELFDPTTETFSLTGSLNEAREFHTATLLLDGRVLVTGGLPAQGTALATAELWDPQSGIWETLESPMPFPRDHHEAIMLPDGVVLLNGPDTEATDVYEPISQNFYVAADLPDDRSDFAVALLPDGRPCYAGGNLGSLNNALDNVVTYASGAFSVQGNAAVGIGYTGATMTVMQDGLALIAGGAREANGVFSSRAEIFNPNTNSFSGSMWLYRQDASDAQAVLLGDGRVLRIRGRIQYGAQTAGGNRGTETCEIYDPVSGLVSSAGDSYTGLYDLSATVTLPAVRLRDGRVLMQWYPANNNSAGVQIYEP